MRKEDLVKKLERVSLPEIEIPSHKRRLRLVLLDRYFQKKRRWGDSIIFRRAFPAGLVMIVLLALFFNYLVFPQYNLAQAEQIALNDPQIKKWVEEGATIKDIKIIKNKAYVLVQPAEELRKETIATGAGVQERKERFFGALAEVDFRRKEVAQIERVSPEIVPLSEKDKEKAKEVAENNSEIQKTLPQESKIIEIVPISPPPLKLIEKDNSVEIAPEPNGSKEVWIIYEHDKKQWESKIDLDKGTLETINYLGEISEETKK